MKRLYIGAILILGLLIGVFQLRVDPAKTPVQKIPKNIVQEAQEKNMKASNQNPSRLSFTESSSGEKVSDKEILLEAQAETLQQEIQNDLGTIKHRKLVQLINDRKANEHEQQAALEFMNNYLKKVSTYIQLKRQLIENMGIAAND